MIKQAPKPKKEYLTKKKLESDLGGTLDKKVTAEQKKTLTKQQAVLQKKLDAIPVKTYSGIWKEYVTTADFELKSSSISAKKAYFQVKLDGGGLSAEDTAKFKLFIKNLDEFETEGKAYHAVQAELKKIKTA